MALDAQALGSMYQMCTVGGIDSHVTRLRPRIQHVEGAAALLTEADRPWLPSKVWETLHLDLLFSGLMTGQLTVVKDIGLGIGFGQML
ncbi:hypothetical protein PG995_004441 [Apiospora arundinis]